MQLVFIDPGRPVQNAHIESFHDKVRDEFLNEPRFATIAEAQVLAVALPIVSIRRDEFLVRLRYYK